jgi:hypothetical protein
MKAKFSFVSLAALLFLSFAACASRPNIQTFFIDSGVQQYFIYPSEMRGAGCKVLIDFTYRSSGEFVICNYTISASDGVSRAYSDLAFVLEDGKTVPLNDTELIVIDKNAKELRLSSRLPIQDFRTVLSSSKTSLAFSMNGKSYSALGGDYYRVQAKAARLELVDNE